MDAESYKDYPINQFEEDNVLRELNKCLLAFRQKTTCSILENRLKKSKDISKRLALDFCCRTVDSILFFSF